MSLVFSVLAVNDNEISCVYLITASDADSLRYPAAYTSKVQQKLLDNLDYGIFQY